MIDALYLAASALRAVPGRTAAIVLAVATTLALPALLWPGVALVERAVMARAESTPIVVGRPGDPMDLTLSALYFTGGVREPLRYGDLEELREEQGTGRMAPLALGHTSSGSPIVGTSLDYFEARGLRVARGRVPALLGEVVAGAGVAEELGLRPGNQLRPDQSNLYNLSGSYPVLLEVVGLLHPTGGPDDEALFTGVHSAWLLSGALHGHGRIDEEDTLRREGEHIEATAALMMFTRLDAESRPTMHLHGEVEEQPISAVLVWPEDDRAHDQLLGRLALDSRMQAVRPDQVVREVLDIVLAVRDALALALGLTVAAAAVLLAIVLSLSLQLRARELALMRRLGAGRARVVAIAGAELLLVWLAAAGVAALLVIGGLASLHHLLPG